MRPAGDGPFISFIIGQCQRRLFQLVIEPVRVLDIKVPDVAEIQIKLLQKSVWTIDSIFVFIIKIQLREQVLDGYRTGVQQRIEIYR